MNSNEILSVLKQFDWRKLNRMYGCAHSSIIGFIAYEWLKISNENSLLDGAPSPKTGEGRTGQKNSDLLLCKQEQPFIPVEVETLVSKYNSKLDALFEYKKAFPTIDFGILYLTNLTAGVKKYNHNWDELKKTIENQAEKDRTSIALISAIKNKLDFPDKNDWSTLLKRNEYSPWEIVQLDYWIYSENNKIEGTLWEK